MAMKDQLQYAKLIALNTLVQPNECLLDREVVTIGRDEGCDLVVQAPIVSRLQARILREYGHYQIIDAGSTNGTFVNGRRLQPERAYSLKHEDEISLGNLKPTLRFVDPLRTDTVPELLVWDESRRHFYFKQKVLELRPTQERLLYYLYQHANKICTIADCMRDVWGNNNFDPRTDDINVLQQAISDIRKQLDVIDEGAAEKLIKTHPRKGYELVY